MKLCKDCKHAVMPNPIHALYGQGYGSAMCGHPDAKRSVVDGSLQTLCVEARGDQIGGATNRSICWPDSKLFEEAPPKEPFNPAPYEEQAVLHHAKPSWWRKEAWKRLFG